MGNDSVIAEYASYLADHAPPAEILSGLVTILRSANKYGFCVDEVLSRFSEIIAHFDTLRDMTSLDRHVYFRYHRILEL